jgi:hypothetical protein
MLAGPNALASAQPGANEGPAACNVVEIGAFSNRVHVQCAPSIGNSFNGDFRPFYATEANSPMAQQLITLAAMARAANKPLRLTVRRNTGLPAGCLASDCGRVLEARLAY